ncbi:MAG: TaqI family restriction endonuclease [Aquificae bacterium]|nr:TaqI family restriction endonuclease [Aquificota bacterium]
MSKGLKEFEEFLKGIDLKKYEDLRKIKTVEQDLPKPLNPLPLLYGYYWEKRDFIDFDEFFNKYWKQNPEALMEFIERYFYGCSLQFVKEGLRARIFRTWVSVLTQFHFQYVWEEYFPEPLEANPELDMKGIDTLVSFGEMKVGVQIKKISYRKEASERKFTKRQRKYVDMLVEVPYLVVKKEELFKKTKSGREDTKKRAETLLGFFEKNFKVLGNGFIVFKRGYVEIVRERIKEGIKRGEDFIPFTEFLPVS